MKKLLIATAALAMVAGTAQAQSTVTVYGKIDSGYSDRKAQSESSGTVTTAKGASIVFSAHETSRFGLRGSEDLGGGLKANFQIETQLGDDTSNSTGALQGSNTVYDETLGGRAMWAGVSGGFGEVRIGLQNAFSKDYVAGFSASGGSNVIGDATMAAGRAKEKTARAGLLDSRYVGASFASPSFSGFKVKAMIVNDKQDQNKDAAGSLDLTGQEFALEFNQGPIAAAASYGTYTVNSATITDANMAFKSRIGQGTTGGINTVTADTTGEYKQKMTTLNASYDLGMAKAFYKYGKVETNNQTSPTATSNGEAVSNVMGVRVPVGKTTFIASYAMGDYTAIGSSTSYDDTGYQLGLEYALSKRTKAYAIYGATETDKSATAKEKDTQMAVGLIHNF